jgi:hypothetical protein
MRRKHFNPDFTIKDCSYPYYKMVVMKVPETMEKYFWDVDWKELALGTGQFDEFILCRIADKGNAEDTRWLIERFTAARIAETVGRSRTVSGKTRHFWKHAAKFL